MTTPYPLLVESSQREAIWGGDALAARYGKHAERGLRIGESWECFDDNRVANGAYAGASLAELRARLGRDLTGRADPQLPFPLLTKLIDARAPLSVQVHPNDAYARRVEHQPVGKTECWVVLEALPDATIVLGWSRATSRGEYLERVADGSLETVLRHVPARAGDVFHLPAGTLHAIGAGIVLFETQQTSDLTYRIFDYNRPGPDGKPRTLHVDKAADVLDYRAATTGAIAPLDYELAGARRTTLVADPNFLVERVAVGDVAHGIDLDGMPLVVLAESQPIELHVREHVVTLAPYRTAVVPAAVDVLLVRANDPGASILTASPPADRDAIERRFARASVSVDRSTSFLAQFSDADVVEARRGT